MLYSIYFIVVYIYFVKKSIQTEASQSESGVLLNTRSPAFIPIRISNIACAVFHEQRKKHSR